MNVLYLTWGETPRSYGVFGSQVIGQFVENFKEIPDAKFYFASALPLIHSGLIREKWRYLSELEKVKNSLGSIPFFLLPIYAPQNIVNSNLSSFKWMHIGAAQHLNILIKKISPNIIHCRSYHAAWAALSVKLCYGYNYKIIFDARGLWPEEIALKKKYTSVNMNYIFLKNIESQLLKKCDVTISVSDSMKAHYNSLGARDVKTVFLSADVKEFAYQEESDKTQNGIINFCYIGALSDDTWHKPIALLELFQNIKSKLPGAKLTIVTTSNHIVLSELFNDFIKDVVLTSTKTKTELKSIMNKMDFGLMSYFKPETEKEFLLSDMVLAVKSAEYLIAGLPMICNKFCGGITSILEENDMGITYDPNSFDGLNVAKIEKFINRSIKKDISEKAKKIFGYKEHALQYADIYKNLVGNDVDE